MSKFWKKIYKSKYTGKEIDDAIGQVIEGGGGDDLAVVHISYNDQDELVADKTFNEIVALIDSGKIVCASYDNHAYTLLTANQNNISFLSPIEEYNSENSIINRSIINISKLNAVSIQYVSTVVTSITIES